MARSVCGSGEAGSGSSGGSGGLCMEVILKKKKREKGGCGQSKGWTEPLSALQLSAAPLRSTGVLGRRSPRSLEAAHRQQAERRDRRGLCGRARGGGVPLPSAGLLRPGFEPPRSRASGASFCVVNPCLCSRGGEAPVASWGWRGWPAPQA